LTGHPTRLSLRRFGWPGITASGVMTPWPATHGACCRGIVSLAAHRSAAIPMVLAIASPALVHVLQCRPADSGTMSLGAQNAAAASQAHATRPWRLPHAIPTQTALGPPRMNFICIACRHLVGGGRRHNSFVVAVESCCSSTTLCRCTKGTCRRELKRPNVMGPLDGSRDAASGSQRRSL
jgi:hypothetical protein